MTDTFTCKAVMGLGITSLSDFVRLMHKYSYVQEVGVAYINASTYIFPKNVELVVFDSVKELFKHHKNIKPNMVVVISDVPPILKEIPDIIPLDYTNDRSFEFNFIEVDPYKVIRMLKSKKSEVTSRLTSFDNLGYHVNRLKSQDGLVNSFISVTASMPFDKRAQLRAALALFFTEKKADITIVTKVIAKIAKTFNFSKEIDLFNKLVNEQLKNYHIAINSGLTPAIAAKKYNLDQYAISFFKRMPAQKNINEERAKKNNVKFKSENAQAD